MKKNNKERKNIILKEDKIEYSNREIFEENKRRFLNFKERIIIYGIFEENIIRRMNKVDRIG